MSTLSQNIAFRWSNTVTFTKKTNRRSSRRSSSITICGWLLTRHKWKQIRLINLANSNQKSWFDWQHRRCRCFHLIFSHFIMEGHKHITDSTTAGWQTPKVSAEKIQTGTFCRNSVNLLHLKQKQPEQSDIIYPEVIISHNFLRWPIMHKFCAADMLWVDIEAMCAVEGSSCWASCSLCKFALFKKKKIN